MIAAIVLAAGMATRMGRNKLLIDLGDGRPLVARVADAALEAGLDPVVVVTGHEAGAIRQALAGRAVAFVHNADFAQGMAGSLRTGLTALPAMIDGVLICLADMPDITAAHLKRIAAAFDPAGDTPVCVPVRDGRRGNPVLLGRKVFPQIAALAGDVGARRLIADHPEWVREVAMDDDAIFADLDTADQQATYRKP